MNHAALTSKLQRTFWFLHGLEFTPSSDSPSAGIEEDRTQVDSLEEANLISSQLPTGNHAPALDIDLPCQLIESCTPGHYHLYIDAPMPWKQYQKLLDALADAGILEKGYVDASKKRGQTFLRKPGVRKSGASL